MVTLPLQVPTTGLIGFEAWQKFLKLFFAEGDHIHLKFSHNQFNYADVKLTGKFPLHTTQLKYKNEPTSRYTTGTEEDAFKFLDKKARDFDGGVFFIPGKPTDFPLKDFCFESDLLSAEFDEGTAEEQWQWIRKVAEISGLAYTLILSSGGKSFHEHWKLDRKIPIAERTNLQRLIAIALDSDPAVTNPHQPMRIPGFFRKEKGNYQVLVHADDTAIYSIDQVVEGLKKLFAYKGLKFPEQPLTDYQFKVYKRIRQNFTPEKWEEILANPEKPEPVRIYKFRLDSEETQKSEQKSTPQTFRTLYSNSESFWEIYNNEVVPRLDAWEIFNSWPGHNYRDRGNGEFDGDCFLHSSSSKTSFAIDINKKLWHSRAGLGGGGFIEYIHALRTGNVTPSSKERYEIACELFQKAGIEIPTHQRKTKTISRHEWEALKARKAAKAEEIILNDVDFDKHQPPEDDSPEIEGTISRGEWRKKFGKKQQPTNKKISQELWEYLHGIPGLFKKELAKIKRKFSGADREKQKNLLQSEVDYVFTELQSRSELVANLLQDGKKIIHFGCHGGQGKTHFVAFLLEKLKEINYECDRVAYGAKSGRNAPTPELEANFRVLTICHNGLAEDPHRKTPLGYPVYVHPTPDNPAVTDGNCHLTAKRQRLIELGYDIHGILACQLLGCKLIDYCGKESGRGYGFRHERKLDLASPRISLNPESLPDELDFLEGTVLVLDELGQLKTGVKDFELGLEDISAMQSYILMNNAPELVRLLEALTALQVFASDDDNLPFYGCDVKQIRTSLNIPESQHEEIVNAAKFIDAKLHREVSGRNLHKAPKVWLNKFFTILFNQQNGFLKINKKDLRKGDNTTKPTNITITTIDDRFRLILERVKAIVILDGTSTKESLSRLMGVDKEEIYSVAQIRPQYNNQKIIRIRGLGNCGGNNPSDSMIKRMNAIEGKVKQLHGENIPILKRTKHSNYEQWWVDSRAQNRDAGVPVRLSFGTPYQNLSALQAQLTTLTGQYHELGEANQRDKTSPELQAEIDFQTLMEFLQDLWRQRVHRYPDREFIQYYVTDFDLSPLTEICPGLQYEEIDAFAFTPEAGDDKQQTKWRITQAIKEKLEAGVEVGKIRQKDILAKAEIGIDWLKKICQGFGGWQQLKKGVAALLKFCSCNTPLDEDQLTEEEQWFLKTWLPLQAKEIKEGNISAVLDVGVYVATYGIKAFEKLCRFLDPSIRADILTGILNILPTHQLEQLLEEAIT